MASPLAGKVAIVTGASSGIGAATARRLARGGARVVLAARRTDRLAALQAEIEETGGAALAAATDVTDRAQLEGLAAAALDRFGRIDLLVNNAGIMPLAHMRKLHVDEWEAMVDVNLKGVLFAIAAVLPTMLDQGEGHIINVSSLASRRPFPGGTVYSATKFAVRSISAGLRNELSPTDRIRVTDIEPGVVESELLDHTTDQESVDRFRDVWRDKRKLASADVAETIWYVASQPPHVNVNEVLVRPTDQPT